MDRKCAKLVRKQVPLWCRAQPGATVGVIHLAMRHPGMFFVQTICWQWDQRNCWVCSVGTRVSHLRARSHSTSVSTGFQHNSAKPRTRSSGDIYCRAENVLTPADTRSNSDSVNFPTISGDAESDHLIHEDCPIQ